MNDLVPSIGSSTHTYSASARSVRQFFTDDAVSRKGLFDQRAHGHFGRAIGGRHRIEAAGDALVLDAQRGTEKRQDRLAGDACELIDESGEVDGGHVSEYRSSVTSAIRRPTDLVLPSLGVTGKATSIR